MSSPFQQKFSGKTPLLQGAYENAADNAIYMSTQPAMNAMFNTIAEVGAAAVKSAYSPENRAKRQDRRVERRNNRADKKGIVGTKNRDDFDTRTGKIEQRSVDNKILAAKNDNSRRCKGRAAGKYTDSNNKPFTCS